MPTDDAKIIDLYRRHAEAWASRRGTDLPERVWLDRFCAVLPPDPSVLDIGCGTGDPVGRFLLGQGAAVTGIDASPELIAIAAARLPQADWAVADMRSLNLGRTFDGLLAWNSSFHLTQDDQRDLFAVFGRHAAPGAALMFTSGPDQGTAIGTFEGEPLYHASLAPTEYRSLLTASGFDLLDHVAKDPTCNGQTVWLARKRECPD